MGPLRNIPIKTKLTAILMLTSGVALLLACFGFVLHDLRSFRQDLVQRLEIQAMIVGTNCAAALEFDEEKTGREILSAFGTDPHLEAACIFNTERRIFARYLRPGMEADFLFPSAQAPGTFFSAQRVQLFRDIRIGNKYVGTIYVQSDLKQLQSRLQYSALISILLLAGAIVVAYLLSAALQRVISGPILDLARTADRVAEEKNYAIRIPQRGQDELGHLIERFNEMLAQIEARDRDLQQARSQLEARVAERTEELSRSNASLTQQIAEREKMDQALRQSGTLYHATVDALMAGIIVTDLELKIALVNAQFAGWCEEAGLKAAELREKNLLEAVRFLPASAQADYRKVAKLGRPIEFEHSFGLGARTMVAEFQLIPIFDKGRVNRIITIVNDVSQHRLVEAQLRQAQKMEAVGQLAGGVAHDFNNLLTVIQGHTGLMLERKGLATDLRESLREVAAAAQRAANLTRQLLAFSRRQVMRREPLNLNELINNLVKMLHRLIGEHIALQYGETPNLPAIDGDPGMIEQVIINLAVNARDAMPTSGVLKIQVTFQEFQTADAALHSERRPGAFVCLAVSDTGCGMDAVTQQRIFEPFFTTKEPGKGTGLGLATVYGIVKQHQGWIELDSRVGVGSTFKVFFPVCQAVADTGEAEPVQAKEVQGNGETILVVEDEDALRRLARTVLQARAYRVLEASNGVQALAVWAQNANQIDLLLTDMVMPGGISGRKLAETMLAQKPDLKVIYTSGYSLDMNAEGFTLQEGVNFLQKPYQQTTLIDLIHATIQRQ